MAYPEITGTIEPEEAPWQAKLAAILARLRSALDSGAQVSGSPALNTSVGLMSPPLEKAPPAVGSHIFPATAPEGFEKWGQGRPPYITGETGLAGRLPAKSREYSAENILDMAASVPIGTASKAPPVAIGAVRKAGDVVPMKIAEGLMGKLTKDLGSTEADKTLRGKVTQWLVKSAGMDDPALKGTKVWGADAGKPVPYDPFEYLRVRDDDPQGLYPPGATRNFARARELPPAPEQSMQELTDTTMRNSLFFGMHKGRPPEDGGFPLHWLREGLYEPFNLRVAEDTGIEPQNLARLAEIMPEGSILARGNVDPSQTALENLTAQVKGLSQWAKDQPIDKLQKMTVPQMFQAREKAMTAALKEYEKVQRGTVVKKFPEKGLEWQKLEPRHLEREGKEMSHCVGDYCNAVERGDIEVYSLRDKNNKPVVTMDLRKPDGDYGFTDRLTFEEKHLIDAFLDKTNAPIPGTYNEQIKEAARQILSGDRFTEVFSPPKMVNQIKGKANSVPAKYADEIEAFLREKGVEFEKSHDWQRIQELRTPVTDVGEGQFREIQRRWPGVAVDREAGGGRLYVQDIPVELNLEDGALYVVDDLAGERTLLDPDDFDGVPRVFWEDLKRILRGGLQGDDNAPLNFNPDDWVAEG